MLPRLSLIYLKDLPWDAVLMGSVVGTVYFIGSLLKNDQNVLVMIYQQRNF